MKIYDAILTKSGSIRSCRLCTKTARVRVHKGGCVYCLDHYVVEVGRSCSLGGRAARRQVEEVQLIGVWLTAALRMGFARQHVLKSYPAIFGQKYEESTKEKMTRDVL